MGMHAAFFAPAKYGAMPEILQPHILSRGNGVLESTTFLAAILGTVAGGLLFDHLPRQGILDRRHPAGPGRHRRRRQLHDRLAAARQPDAAVSRRIRSSRWSTTSGLLFRSRPLALAVLGIAFFIFMVAYMRAVDVHARRDAQSRAGTNSRPA